ncbi:MAG: hypothetical protein ACP5GJ_00380 [Nanopusillaceae archaeon]|jgi:hypothetical protein
MRSINKMYIVLFVVIVLLIGLLVLLGQKTEVSTPSSYTQPSAQQYKPTTILELTLYNNQIQTIPPGFQQDIAICNGSMSLGSGFYYIDNYSIFLEINPNGQNALFFTNTSNLTGSLLYSWYEGQLNNNGITCDVWWVKLPNGISNNTNITIYMGIGSNNIDYYQLYYPYVGANPYVVQGYDNGQQVFTYYWTPKDFNNPSLFGIIGKIYNGSNYVYLNSFGISGIYTLNTYNLSGYMVDFYLSLLSQEEIKFGTGTSLNISCSTDGAYCCANPSLYNTLLSIVDGNSLSSFLYNANVPAVYSIGYNNYISIFLNNYHQAGAAPQVPKVSNANIFVFGQNVTNLQIYWIRIRILPPFGNMPQIYITGLFK